MHFNNDTDLYRTIGSNIKYYRQQANLTQMQLAEKAQISISYLSKIEASGCDKSLSISVLNQIANVLNVEINDFLRRRRQMPRQANRFGGGANTNRNGLHFEQTTSLNTALQNAGFIIANHFEVYDRNQLLGYSINQDEFSTIFLRQNGINDRAINSKRWKPDEAFINGIDKTVYIIEKKFQRTSGSVDEKLATFPFKIREYRRLLDPIGYDLVYIYLLSSDWFNVPKYQDYYDYMDELDCPHYFDNLPLYAIGL